MGMSTHIVGLVPPDEHWKKMKQVWDSCKSVGIEVPKPVQEFFNWEAPDERGVEVEIPLIEWSEETMQGYELELDKIPANVKVIRFYNSW